MSPAASQLSTRAHTEEQAGLADAVEKVRPRLRAPDPALWPSGPLYHERILAPVYQWGDGLMALASVEVKASGGDAKVPGYARETAEAGLRALSRELSHDAAVARLREACGLLVGHGLQPSWWYHVSFSRPGQRAVGYEDFLRVRRTMFRASSVVVQVFPPDAEHVDGSGTGTPHTYHLWERLGPDRRLVPDLRIVDDDGTIGV